MEYKESLLNNDLQVDPATHAHLSETAKWAKFIAIAGFVFSLCIMIFALYYASRISEMGGTGGYRPSRAMRTEATLVVIFYALVALVWFLVSVFHFRFASKMQLALQLSDQVEFNNACRNLKLYYRTSGIVTIISLGLTLLALIGILMSSPGSGF